MSLFEIRRNPSRVDLWVFVIALPVFFGLVGGQRWLAGSTRVAIALWSAGAFLFLVALVAPPARRWIYMGWTVATYPVAWVVSHALLALVYFGVVTPVALLLRVLGRDPLQRRFDRGAASYWVAKKCADERSRYFRQY